MLVCLMQQGDENSMQQDPGTVKVLLVEWLVTWRRVVASRCMCNRVPLAQIQWTSYAAKQKWQIMVPQAEPPPSAPRSVAWVPSVLYSRERQGGAAAQALAGAQEQEARRAHWHSVEKPWGPQQEAKGTAWPARVALHCQMLRAPLPAPLNLPAGSSSCGRAAGGRGGEARVAGEVRAVRLEGRGRLPTLRPAHGCCLLPDVEHVLPALNHLTPRQPPSRLRTWTAQPKWHQVCG